MVSPEPGQKMPEQSTEATACDNSTDSETDIPKCISTSKEMQEIQNGTATSNTCVTNCDMNSVENNVVKGEHQPGEIHTV